MEQVGPGPYKRNVFFDNLHDCPGPARQDSRNTNAVLASDRLRGEDRLKLMLYELVPWRVRNALSERRERRLREACDDAAVRTATIQAGTDPDAFSIHVLLGHRHVGMCLWTLKSFLRAAGRAFRIYLHDDGSLTRQDAQTLAEHLVGAKVVLRPDADQQVNDWLRPYANCHAYRFSSKMRSDHRGEGYDMRVFSLKLFDFNFLGSSDKRLFLDTDILFFRRPEEILQWIDTPSDRSVIHTVESHQPVRSQLGRLSFVCKERTFNSGIVGLPREVFDLATLDAWIGAHRDLMETNPTFEQAAYRELIRTRGQPRMLPDTYSFNYTDDDVTATHFGIKVRFFENLHRVAPMLSQ